ncbi:glycoside hydrolase family 19 protein [Larkinella soli]|uniref:glycoside hydrolase family 19 protein n=1 Tax=Larkinella soli TaxID=1770527 RepID=UPI000FFBBD90|nr:glycoside hydrolase family 19 protein [Larkinella soli]
MLTFNRKKFFDTYRARFGPLTQPLVDALEFLLAQIEQDDRFTDSEKDRRQLAYCLATFKWETAHTMRPIDEIGTTDHFNKRYGPETKVGKMLGNTLPGDGARFHGRGYVQLTGRANYERAGKFLHVDLLENPELAEKPDLAYRIAVQGMKGGWFTGKKLDNFIRDGFPPEYERARFIINGQDKAQTIADLARRFDEVLLAAKEKPAPRVIPIRKLEPAPAK